MPRPTAVAGLAIGAAVTTVALTAAAFWLSYEHLHDIAQENGLYQGGDYFPNALSDVHTPFASRPLSVVAALRCAVEGDPRSYSLLADEALMVLALRLEVDGEGPEYMDLFGLEDHVDSWGDAEGRTTESAVAVLYAAADASEVAA